MEEEWKEGMKDILEKATSDIIREHQTEQKKCTMDLIRLEELQQTKTLRKIIEDMNIHIPTGKAGEIGQRIVEELEFSKNMSRMRRKENIDGKLVNVYCATEWDIAEKHVRIRNAELVLHDLMDKNEIPPKTFSEDDIFISTVDKKQPMMSTFLNNNDVKKFLFKLVGLPPMNSNYKQSFKRFKERLAYQKIVVDLLNAVWGLVHHDELPNLNTDLIEICEASAGPVDEIVITLSGVLKFRMSPLNCPSSNVEDDKKLLSVSQRTEELLGKLRKRRLEITEWDSTEGKTLDEIFHEHNLPPTDDENLYKTLTNIGKGLPRKRVNYNGKPATTPLFQGDNLRNVRKSVAEYHNCPELCDECKKLLVENITAQSDNQIDSNNFE